MNDTFVADERVNFDRPEGNDDDNPHILWLVEDEGDDDGEENDSISCDKASVNVQSRTVLMCGTHRARSARDVCPMRSYRLGTTLCVNLKFVPL